MHPLTYFGRAMSRNQRIALVVGALVVAVVAFVVAQPGGDDESEPEPRAPAAQTETERSQPAEPSEPAEPAEPAEPPVKRIRIEGGTVVGGPKDIEVTNGDVVRIVVSSDAPDDLHLHGYDIERSAAPGKPARFVFRADAEGAFELESHVAEDAGREPLVARIVVQPS
jgi:FtsP/CotA-like multicopper oxidase with cupredoxin domain